MRFSDPDFSAALFQTEDRGPGRASGAEHQNFRVLDGEALLQRTNHAGYVGIETVELAFLSADNGIAGSDLRRVRVGVIEIRKDGLLVRHGDAETVQRNLAHAVDQILERFGVQRKIDAVHVLTAQRRVHDDGRERMLDGIAGDSIDASGGVDLLDAVDTAQIPRTELGRARF